MKGTVLKITFSKFSSSCPFRGAVLPESGIYFKVYIINAVLFLEPLMVCLVFHFVVTLRY
jgi:hypothetical protein